MPKHLVVACQGVKVSMHMGVVNAIWSRFHINAQAHLKMPIAMHGVKHISIYIDCAPEEVYSFVSNARNLPTWAAGLARSEVKKEGDAWVAEAPFGKVRIRFAETNVFGVLDHDVELDSGLVVHNPMRVVPNGHGSEFIFNLMRQPGMTDEQFAEDAKAVARDLKTLKALLEGSCSK
jgi:hypothetical protein